MKFFGAPKVALTLLIMLSTAPSHGQTLGEAWTISLGGRLYDNHWLETGTPPPAQRNPDYPTDLDVSAGNSWRCVSCHGWDYRGRDGHLGKISKSGTFANLRRTVGKDPADLSSLMLANGHRHYMAGLAKPQVETLALFFSLGQFNAAELIPSGKSVGNAIAGKDIFEGACISCHQADGNAYIQGESGDRSSLGWIAQNRPAQALHKIINGVPGADMLSLRFLPKDRLADLLAYVQSLDASDE